MKRYFHLLWFEVLRLKWVLIWLLGLVAAVLTVHAWLVFGPAGKNWPEAPGLDLAPWLLYPSLIFFSAALFLEHSNVGIRGFSLTQAIPRFLFPAVKLPLLALILCFFAVFSSLIGRIHGSPVPETLGTLPITAICLIFAWLSAQSETPVGIAKHLALWAVGIYSYIQIFSFLVGMVGYDPHPLPDRPGEPLLALMALAPPLIVLQSVTRRTWLKVAASVFAILLLFDAPYWTIFAGPEPKVTPAVPADSPELAGQATFTTLEERENLTVLNLRLEPGLLGGLEFSTIASATLQTSGEPIQLNDTSWGYYQQPLAELRRNCLNQQDNSVTRRTFEARSTRLADVRGGEAILRIFRIDRLPGVINPDQSEVTYRVNGRNERISVNRESQDLMVTWIQTGFERNVYAEPWRHDLRHPGPTVVRATPPGLPPLLIELTDGRTLPTNGGFMKRSFLASASSGTSASQNRSHRQFEFFQDHFVRTVRVRLVMEK